jgi:hypothetical protein
MKIGCAAFVGAFTIAVFAASLGAAQTIGGAVAVQREVSGQLSGRPRAIATGDDVHQNETIRTGAASSTELGFVDQTRLAVGASAAVKLDRFVFDPDRGARSVVLTATKGVARFVSGAGPSAVYQVRTPHATIGVSGRRVPAGLAAHLPGADSAGRYCDRHRHQPARPAQRRRAVARRGSAAIGARRRYDRAGLGGCRPGSQPNLVVREGAALIR